MTGSTLNNMRPVAILLVGLSLALDYASAGIINYKNPIRSKAEDEVKSLPGVSDKIKFKQYSGYLKADKDVFFHYWLAESQSEPSKDPLLLWLNGGPGCSSLSGMFSELGPFIFDEKAKKLKTNPYAWNKAANVLFLESPADVGYSYGIPSGQQQTDDLTAKRNHQALKSFLEKFPEFAKSELYLAGESYAGVYLPSLGVLVDEDQTMNLRGLAIGNGYLNADKLAGSLQFFAYHHGIVDNDYWKKFSKACCNGNPPSRSTCNLNPTTKDMYDCRIMIISVQELFQGVNPYNIYADCINSPSDESKNVSRQFVDINMLFGQTDNLGMLGVPVPCIDDTPLEAFMATKEVRELMHVPDELDDWSACSWINYYPELARRPDGMAAEIKKLLASKRKLNILVYNGDVDSVCNFLGDEWFVDDLGLSVTKEFQFWVVDGKIAGGIKSFDGLTFATVRGSGHMVPADRPEEALVMIQNFIATKDRFMNL